MRKKSRPPNIPRPWWHVGMRVRRMTSDELGTIAEADGTIKVDWDNGQASYYKRGGRFNVRLKLAKPRK